MEELINKSGIYMITCVPTGEIYVGSSICIKRRWYQHTKMLKKGNHHSYKLQKVWDEYGEYSFTFSILSIVENIDNIFREEQFFIDELSPELNIKMKVACTITSKRILVSAKGKFANRVMQKRRRVFISEKPVIQFSIEGKFIAEYNSILSACISLGDAGSIQGIHNNCIGKQITGYGFKWMLKSDLGERKISDIENELQEKYIKEKELEEWRIVNHKIIQVTYEGDIVNEFDNMTEAANYVGVSRTCISACVNERQESSGGFLWMMKYQYNEEYIYKKLNENKKEIEYWNDKKKEYEDSDSSIEAINDHTRSIEKKNTMLMVILNRIKTML